jgi:hypothetical protein
MAEPGSYNWWRANYKTDDDFRKVAKVLTVAGVDCTEVDVDHFPPNSAYTGTQYENMLNYGARPAFPLPKVLHRFAKGDGGMGGHVSTTGNTAVSQGWTPMLREAMSAGNFYEAMKKDVIDKQNVALSAGATKNFAPHNRRLFNLLMMPAVDLALRKGMITQSQYYDLRLNYLSCPL